MSENGTFHITMMKNWVSHILFLRKRGHIVYLAALKKDAIRAAHPYYVIYRYSYPPPGTKSVVAGPAGPAFARPTFWPSMLSTMFLYLVSIHFSLSLPLILFNHATIY